MTTGDLCALSLLQQDKTPAFPCLEPAVDLGPEGAEVIYGGPDCEKNHEVKCDSAGLMEDYGFVPQNQKSDRHNLSHHLDLAFARSIDRETLRGRDASQSADGKLTPDNDHDHPCGNILRIELNERDKGGRNKKLVGDRVQQYSQSRHLSPLSGQVAIQQVRERCGQEDRGGHLHVVLGQENGYQYGNQEYATERQGIRQIHIFYGCALSGLHSQPLILKASRL